MSEKESPWDTKRGELCKASPLSLYLLTKHIQPFSTGTSSSDDEDDGVDDMTEVEVNAGLVLGTFTLGYSITQALPSMIIPSLGIVRR